MKVVQETATKLVCRQGMNLFLLIWSLGFGGIPLIMMVGLSADVGLMTVECDRPVEQSSRAPAPNPTVRCKIQSSTFWGLSPQPAREVRQVLRANPITETKSGSDDCSRYYDHQLVLTSMEGVQTRAMGENMYRNCVRGNETRFENYAAQLNQFIASDETSIKVTYGNRLNGFNIFMMALCGPFILISGIMLYGATRSVTLSIDKVSGTMTWREWTFLSVLKQRKFQAADIKSLDVVEKEDSDGEKSYWVSIVPKQGPPIALDPSTNPQTAKTLAEKILEAMTLPGL